MKFQIALTAVVVTALGMLSSASGAALFEEGMVVRVPRGTFGPRSMMGDFLMLKDGTLVMSFGKDGAIMAIKSTDQGKTWGQPFTLVANPPSPGYFCHPSFLRLSNGEILSSYIYATGAETPYYGHSYYRRSPDEGKTWSEQFVMTPHPGCVYIHNDRLQSLSTGRILTIAEYKAHMPSTADHAGFVGMSFFSDNRGYVWQASKNTVDMYPVEFQEADAVELKDGRIMLFARTYNGHPARAYSNDKGETWSRGELIKNLVMGTASFPSVRRIPSTGDLLFVWGSEASSKGVTTPRRCALTTAISQDDGKTFLHLRNIARDPEDDYGYQCIEFVGKDMALIGYHCRDGLRVARIGIDWFYGK
jgi:sialidase-1